MKVQIRNAKKEDSSFIAWIILSAGRSGMPKGFWDIFLNLDESETLKIIEKLVLSDIMTLCHYSVFLIAEVDGKPAAGMSCFYPKDLTGPIFREATVQLFKKEGWSDEQIIEGRDRVMPNFRCFPGYPEDHWVIEWVACKPEFRRMGLVEQLLRECIARGEKQGAKLFQIIVAKGNAPAENAYAKVGFQFASEKTSLEFQKLFGHQGLTRLTIQKT